MILFEERLLGHGCSLMTDVSIVICTYNRPDLLKKTIRSCVEQEVAPDLIYEIVVVDNSSDGNAQESVELAAAATVIPIRYLNESRPNISHARNCGVANAKGRYVAFIDDDEQASSGWLQALVDACRAHGADMVLGPVDPVFASGSPPSWDPRGIYYRRDRKLETGGLVTSTVNTGNLLIDATTCLKDDAPFNPEFGQTGGEDTDYSMRMQSLGKRAIWCAEARVTEYLPQAREQADYIVGRAFRSAQSYYRCRVANSVNPLAIKLYALGAGIIEIAGWAFPWLLTRPFETAFSVKCRVHVARGLGKLTWWRPLPRP